MNTSSLVLSQYVIYCLLATRNLSCPMLGEELEGIVSPSHIHKLVNDGIAAKEIKRVGFDNSRPGPPARIFTLTAKGKKLTAEQRKRLRGLGL